MEVEIEDRRTHKPYNEETDTKLAASGEMELNIAPILNRIDSFTHTGKQCSRNSITNFSEHMIMIHKEHVEKWQEEIKDSLSDFDLDRYSSWNLSSPIKAICIFH
ncbi:uncharacterized protein LOC112083539 [Eutrema salsugineum]|uniref:uncharacterized protein LOC112083539 n=1 Tax=Eutrema salsugineum TaxID=72664 RepID=UPI000CED0DD8|nr:uncharacterized protein LOC112083539 [Eutrema salsugineum]XP_024007470.1 uncharacterized protein LOC112083539 [Eutrema salsugineum]XP_024007471.1 uncharacterized protein LOC112083539 [Eutrema salsugineum]